MNIIAFIIFCFLFGIVLFISGVFNLEVCAYDNQLKTYEDYLRYEFCNDIELNIFFLIISIIIGIVILIIIYKKNASINKMVSVREYLPSDGIVIKNTSTKLVEKSNKK